MTESMLLAHLTLALLVLHGKHQAPRFSLGREQALLLHRFIISLLQIYEQAVSHTDATTPANHDRWNLRSARKLKAIDLKLAAKDLHHGN